MKWKELRVTFSHSRKNFDPIKLNGQDLERVQQVKILRLQISSDIKWNSHWPADLGLRVCVESSTYFHMSRFETMTLFRTKNPKIHTLFRTTPSILLPCLCRQYPVHN